MPITKHILFKIKVALGAVDTDTIVMKEIENFLNEVNVVYVNHSITTMEIKSTSGMSKGNYLFLSIVYKDLNEPNSDLKNVSKKTKDVIVKSVESGEVIPSPNIQTEFEKKLNRKT